MFNGILKYEFHSRSCHVFYVKCINATLGEVKNWSKISVNNICRLLMSYVCVRCLINTRTDFNLIHEQFFWKSIWCVNRSHFRYRLNCIFWNPFCRNIYLLVYRSVLLVYPFLFVFFLIAGMKVDKYLTVRV